MKLSPTRDGALQHFNLEAKETGWGHFSTSTWDLESPFQKESRGRCQLHVLKERLKDLNRRREKANSALPMTNKPGTLTLLQPGNSTEGG